MTNTAALLKSDAIQTILNGQGMYGLAEAADTAMKALQRQSFTLSKDARPPVRDWYLAIFKESDTGYVLIPRVVDYVGSKTAITTKDHWIIIDMNEPIEYINKLECIGWMRLLDDSIVAQLVKRSNEV